MFETQAKTIEERGEKQRKVIAKYEEKSFIAFIDHNNKMILVSMTMKKMMN